MPEKGKKSVAVPEEVHGRIKLAAATVKRQMEDLIQEAWNRYEQEVLKGHTAEPPSSKSSAPAPAGPYPKEDQPFHDMLQFIFDGDQEHAGWLKGNIQTFYELAQVHARRAKALPHKRRKSA